MKKYLLATTCVACLSGGASAADLPLKSRAPAYQPAVADWTGPYIGAHVGVARMNAECNQGFTSFYACGYGYGSCAAAATGIAGGVRDRLRLAR